MRYKSQIFEPANKELDLLSRIKLHSSLHDTGFISAFRPEYDEVQNEERERWLKAFLIEKGYYLISVKGCMQTKGSENKQSPYTQPFCFVTEWYEANTLEANLRLIGDELGQTPVLFKKRAQRYFKTVATATKTSVDRDNQCYVFSAKQYRTHAITSLCLILNDYHPMPSYAGNLWTRYLASVRTQIAPP